MLVRRTAPAIFFLALAALPALAKESRCTIGKLAELPVTMNGMRPMVTARINGREAQFIADSGAVFSVLSPAAAAEFQLHLQPAPYHLQLQGMGGKADASVTTVKEFTLAGVPIHNVQFLVGGSEPGAGAAGVIGQNVLRLADAEYDLQGGVIRLLKPTGCDNTPLSYWTKEGQPYSVMDIAWGSTSSPNTTGTAYLNGARLRVVFDTGSTFSILSTRAAERAGVRTDSDVAIKAGQSRGVGSHLVQTWIAPFESFKIGDEEVHHTRLRIGDLGALDADMLLGADFFLSHHLYVASSQHRLYFTYNGGPVFNLATAPPGAPSAVAPTPSPAGDAPPPDGTPSGPAPAPPDATPAAAEGQPADAAGFLRRGSAFAARRDFAHAIEDFTRACELAPQDPAAFVSRAQAYLASGRAPLAAKDLDQAVALKSDHVTARMMRAALRLSNREANGGAGTAEALADLNAASGAAPREADLRLGLGNLFGRAGALQSAIAEFDLWIDKHPDDVRRADAYALRCRARAMTGQDLDKALSDCNRAARDRPDNGFVFDSRGIVNLLLRKTDKAIADYDTALKLQPKNPWALYGRGVAMLRSGRSAEGEADIAASRAINPRVAEEAARRGIAP